MHAVVVGCGRVGSSVATALAEAGHSVSIIDKDSRSFQRLPGHFRGRRIHGLGFDRDRLAEAGIAQAGAVAAVTNGDNSNIVVARVAKEVYRIPRVVARIYDPRRALIYERLGITTVATVTWSTDRVMRNLVPETSPVAWVDPTARVCLAERSVPTAWVGKRVDEVEESGLRVVAVSRLGESRVAGAAEVFETGDVVWLAAPAAELGRLDERLTSGRWR